MSVPSRGATTQAGPPAQEGERWSWSASGVPVTFTGKGFAGSPKHALRQLPASHALAAAWLEQTHSATVLPAVPGACGQGDALWTREPGLALAVKTADCVPIVLVGGGVVAAIHAGWRGIVQEIVAAAVAALPVSGAALAAWIGPAIGPCCYEVGDEVAEQVAAAANATVVVPGVTTKPYLDLRLAAELQLRAAGVKRVERVGECTRCRAEALHSYRRDGKQAGRNFAFVWLDGA